MCLSPGVTRDRKGFRKVTMPTVKNRCLIAENFEVSPKVKELAKHYGWPDPDQQLDAFKDYHKARGTLMADWEAAFRTWLRNAKEWGKTKPQVKEPTRSKQFDRPPLTEEQRAQNSAEIQKIVSELSAKKNAKPTKTEEERRAELKAQAARLRGGH